MTADCAWLADKLKRSHTRTRSLDEPTPAVMGKQHTPGDVSLIHSPSYLSKLLDNSFGVNLVDNCTQNTTWEQPE